MRARQPRTASTYGWAATIRAGIARSRTTVDADQSRRQPQVTVPRHRVDRYPVDLDPMLAAPARHPQRERPRSAGPRAYVEGDPALPGIARPNGHLDRRSVHSGRHGAGGVQLHAARRSSSVVARYECSDAISRARFGGQQKQEYQGSRRDGASSWDPSCPVRSCSGLE